MPTFPRRDQSEQPIVSRVVVGSITLASEEMGQRIDGKASVPEKHCRYEESPNQALKIAERQSNEREHHRRQEMDSRSVEYSEFREPGQIAHEIPMCIAPFGIEEPADVRIPKPAVARRMHVRCSVGMLVVVTMVASPPEDAFLRRALGTDS